MPAGIVDSDYTSIFIENLQGVSSALRLQSGQVSGLHADLFRASKEGWMVYRGAPFTRTRSPRIQVCNRDRLYSGILS